jgi:hypothetical protein
MKLPGRSLLLTLLFLLAAFCVPCVSGGLAQTKHPSNIFLSLGSVTVWLGMPEVEALREFRNAGFRLDSRPDAISKLDQYIVMDDAVKTAGIPRTFVTAFRNGKLTYAARDWPIIEHDTMDAVMGALGRLTFDTPTFCTVNTSPISNPNMKADRIVIDCDARSVVLLKGKIQSGGNFADDTQVTEQIGHLP